MHSGTLFLLGWQKVCIARGCDGRRVVYEAAARVLGVKELSYTLTAVVGM